MRDRLPELLALSLRQPALPAVFYRHVLDFLASNPNPEQIVAFRPSPEMQRRLAALLECWRAVVLTALEAAELDEFGRIEHLMIMVKAGALPSVTLAL